MSGRRDGRGLQPPYRPGTAGSNASSTYRDPFADPFADPEGSSSSASSIHEGVTRPPTAQLAGSSPEDEIRQAPRSNRPAPPPPKRVQSLGHGLRPQGLGRQGLTPEFNEKADYEPSRPQIAPQPGYKQEAPVEIPRDNKNRGFWGRQYDIFRATYYPVEDAPLILPSGTTDEEKYSYLRTNRLPLYMIGMFSFLSLSAGMWLFVLTSVYFYWVGLIVGLLQIYLLISYTITIVGKDFDFEDHKRILRENPITPETAPTVDIYLPCCKEPVEVIANTYKYIKQLQWPEGKLKVYVLDDGNMEEIRQLAESYGFNYIVREDRPRLKKAGNLRWAFARTQGDFFTIFDADFCPRSDFLLELVPQHLDDPKTALIQSPQFFRVKDEQTWVEQGAGGIQELFYRVVEVNRNRWGASICVGSNAVYRREALVETGGTAEIGFSEDVHTGFYAVNRGWKVKYVPLCLACGVCPDTPHAFFSQQMRWCMGSTTLLTNPDFWKSNLNFIQKVCYASGMMYYTAISICIFLNPVPGILLLWVRPEYFKYYNLAFALPSIVYSLIALRAWAKAKYSLNVQFIMVIQSYAYLTAIKDRVFGRALAWVPSGDNKGHKNNKYRNMRILCWCWTITYVSALTAALVYRSVQGGKDFHIYNAIPMLLLDSMNIFFAHRFLFCMKMDPKKDKV